jgi:hypothetical protein
MLNEYNGWAYWTAMGGAPRGMDILNGVVSAVSELVIPPKSFCFNILGMRRRSSIVGQSL